ncbi:MAG: NTP transferase domain-containing protein [Gammaproteobacteria bacterium]|nr:NTP transferase domain-containing protein [Gammaproteobacteria bacterium]
MSSSVSEASLAPLAGLLLTGGASRRMGCDKAALVYAGEPQLVRAWRLLQAVGVDPCLLAVRADQADEPLRLRYPQVVDVPGVAGPMAGLLAAHRHAPDRAWLVLACDLPLVDRALLVALVRARDAASQAVAYAAEGDGRPEPLCTIYEPGFCREALEPAAARGERSLRRCLEAARVRLLPPPGARLTSVDTDALRAVIAARLDGPP